MIRFRSIPSIILALAAAAVSTAVAAPIGNFVAILDQRSTTSAVVTPTQRSVVFYDTANMANPLFSVFVGYERPDGQGPNNEPNPEDPSAITVDPLTGNIYVAAFDSGDDASVVDSGAFPLGIGPGLGDTNGDTDLYRIDFQAAYNYWETNGQTYMTFWDYGLNPALNPNDHHANPVHLSGVNTKVGEVARLLSGAAPFFDQRLVYLDEDTILMLDNDSGVAANFATDDHAVRVLNRVSTSPGAATWNSQNNVNSAGGFNRGTSESWESVILGQLQMDVGGFSEPVGMAYVNRDGVEGIWVLEGDTPAATGDQVSFFRLQRDGNNKLVGLTFNSSFTLDNDPVGNPGAEDGDGGWIGVDAAGNLLISESGFFDGVGHDPKIMIANVANYDDGGVVNISGWTVHQLNIPALDDDDASIADDRNVVYDHVSNAVYYFDPDANEGAVPFAADIYRLDLDTGVTTTITIDHDDFSWFNNEGVSASVLAFFSLTSSASDGDLNDDGFVNADDIDVLWHLVRNGGADPNDNDDEDLNGDGFINEDDVDYMLANLLDAGSNRAYGDADLDGGVGGLDFTAWRLRAGTGWANGDFDGDGGIGGLDFTLWRTRPTTYPSDVGPHAGGLAAVPEPGSLVLLSLAIPALVLAARQRRTVWCRH